ncbi:MAG: hypothetical protein HY321_06375 [Armatimonadetes bacterium]|nr:hypothetical protein [Armatimonadota bacterium]
MIFDWQAAFSSDALYHGLMLAESVEQLQRAIARARPVMLLLEQVRREPALGAAVYRHAVSLLGQPVTPGELSDAEVPLCCCLYVLCSLERREGRWLLEEVAVRARRELGWTVPFAQLCAERLPTTTAGWPATLAAGIQHQALVGSAVGEIYIGGSDVTDDALPEEAAGRLVA